jgi:hypothetical protein
MAQFVLMQPCVHHLLPPSLLPLLVVACSKCGEDDKDDKDDDNITLKDEDT